MLIKCKTGGELLDVPEGQDPHAALDATGCSHCADKGAHGDGPGHHAERANACPRTHQGPCWNPPAVPDRPDGCWVCRPVLFMGGGVR